MQECSLRIEVSHDPAELYQLFQLRYQNYVEHYGEKQRYADHSKKMIVDPEDEYSLHLVAKWNQKIIGGTRVTLWKKLPEKLFDNQKRMTSYFSHCGIDWPEIIPRELSASCAKICTVPGLPDFYWPPIEQKTRLGMILLYEQSRHCFLHGTEINIGVFQPKLSDYVQPLGFRTVQKNIKASYNDNGKNDYHLNAHFMWDQSRLVQLESPLRHILSGESASKEKTERLKSWLEAFKQKASF